MDEAWNEGKETWEAYLARIKDAFAEKAAAATVKRGQAPGADAAEAAAAEAVRKVVSTPPAARPRNLTQERWNELEHGAARHMASTTPMAPGMETLYYAMSGIYATYRAGRISREEAKKKKLALIAWCDEAQDKDDGAARVGEFFKRVAEAARAYALAPSLETADGLYWACYKMLPRKRMEQEETA